MPKQSNFQKALFENIRSRLSPHLSLVDEVADLLNLSSDSAYRRIRGDKPLSLNEAEQLAQYFKLSLDSLLGIASDSVTFQSQHLDEDDYNFQHYLESLLAMMTGVSDDPSLEVIFQLNELNLYHVIQFPELLAFKIYYWSKSSLDFQSFSEKKFSISDIDERILELSSEITDYYVKLNTTELLTPEFLASFLKQVEFYRDSGFFENNEDAINLCERALELIEHLRKQAELGYKFAYGSKPSGQGGEFNLYCNNIALVDNTILVGIGEQGMTYLTNGAINLLVTTNQDFYQRNLNMARGILRRSIPISDNSERERNLFCNNLKDSVIRVMERLPRERRY